MDHAGVEVRCEGLVHIYRAADLEVVALQGLDLEVAAGEIVAMIGSSGSGKTTLLNVVGGLSRPSAGSVTVGGTDLLGLDDAALATYRRDTVGFVWQNIARNLRPYLTGVQNVELPMLLGPRRAGRLRGATRRRRRAEELLEMLGLSDRRHSRLTELSGGEQQRVALALALANNPPLLLADEPTGSLNREAAAQLLESLREVNRLLGLTVIIVTHDQQIAQSVQRVVAIRDGRTSSEFIRRDQTAAAGGPGPEVHAHHIEDAGTHDELAVIDRAGRVQVPREYLDALEIRGRDRVRVELEGDRVVIRRVP